MSNESKTPGGSDPALSTTRVIPEDLLVRIKPESWDVETFEHRKIELQKAVNTPLNLDMSDFDRDLIASGMVDAGFKSKPQSEVRAQAVEREIGLWPLSERPALHSMARTVAQGGKL